MAREILDLGVKRSKEIQEEDRLSKGSDCHLAPVYYEDDNTIWCSTCGEQCLEVKEDDDEFIERLEREQEEEQMIIDEINDVIDNDYG